MSFTVSDSRDTVCFFGTSFRVRVCFFGSRSGIKYFFTGSGFRSGVCFTGSGFRVRVLRDRLVFLLRDWLVLRFSWSGAEMALISGPSCFISLALISGHMSFTGSGSRAKVCFFGSGFRVRVCFLGSGFRAKSLPFAV